MYVYVYVYIYIYICIYMYIYLYICMCVRSNSHELYKLNAGTKAPGPAEPSGKGGNGSFATRSTSRILASYATRPDPAHSAAVEHAQTNKQTRGRLFSAGARACPGAQTNNQTGPTKRTTWRSCLGRCSADRAIDYEQISYLMQIRDGAEQLVRPGRPSRACGEQPGDDAVRSVRRARHGAGAPTTCGFSPCPMLHET